jgi:hypothetical protein
MWKAAMSTIMSKWKWLFVDGFKCEHGHYHDRIFDHTPRSDKFIIVLQDYIEKITIC